MKQILQKKFSPSAHCNWSGSNTGVASFFYKTFLKLRSTITKIVIHTTLLLQGGLQSEKKLSAYVLGEVIIHNFYGGINFSLDISFG